MKQSDSPRTSDTYREEPNQTKTDNSTSFYDTPKYAVAILLGGLVSKTYRRFPESKNYRHIARRYFFVQGLVEEGKITIHYVKTQDQLADLAKHLSRQRHRVLIELVDEFKAWTMINASLRRCHFFCTFLLHRLCFVFVY